MTLLSLTAILFALQLLDWWSTRTIINKGGYEQNPVMKKLFGEFGMDITLGMKTIVVTGLGYFAGEQEPIALALIVGIYLTVIVHNWKSI